MVEPTVESLVRSFTGVRIFQANGRLAPHKPLLLIIALSRVQSGQPRLSKYEEIHPLLAELLGRFNPTGLRHTHYPFWRLQNDPGHIWEIPERETILKANAASAKPDNVPRGLLVAHQARGGFPEGIFGFLRKHPSVVNQLAEEILQTNFPSTYHEDILDAVGFPWVVEEERGRKRDPGFRGKVLAAYNYTCAVCSYDGRLGEKSLGIEAAHIRWHSAGGPDEVDNGLALCTFHHKAFDFGALGVNDSSEVIVSRHVNGREMTKSWLGQFHGRLLLQPIVESQAPKPKHIRWHRERIFKGAS